VDVFLIFCVAFGEYVNRLARLLMPRFYESHRHLD